MPFLAPQNFFYGSEWALKLIDAELAWQYLHTLCWDNSSGPDCGQPGDYTYGDPRLILALFDPSGVESEEVNGVVRPASIDLRGNTTLVPTAGETAAKCQGFLSKDGDGIHRYLNLNDPIAPHGTNCAGLLTAKPYRTGHAIFDGGGVIGVAPNCRYIATSSVDRIGFAWALNLLPTATLNNYSAKDPYISALFTAPGFKNAAGGADIISMSFLLGNTDEPMINNLMLFGRRGRGPLLLVGAGNEGKTVQENDNPPKFYFIGNHSDKVMVVGATEIDRTYNETWSSYSNTGKRVSFSAPSGASRTNEPTASNYAIKSPTTTIKNYGLLDNTYFLRLQATAFNDNKIIEFTPATDLSYVRRGLCISGTQQTPGGNFVEARTILDKTVGNPPTVELDEAFKDLKYPNGQASFSMDVALNARPLAQNAATGSTILRINPEDAVFFKTVSAITICEYNAANHIIEHPQDLVISVASDNGEITVNSALLRDYNAGNSIVLINETLEITVGKNDIVRYGENRMYISTPSADRFRRGMRLFILEQGSTEVLTSTFVEGIAHNAVLLTDTPELNYDNEFQVPNYSHNGPFKVLATGGGQYRLFNGTSGATPVTAGVFALMLTANPKLSWLEAVELMKLGAEKKKFGAFKDDSAGSDWRDESNERLFKNGGLNTTAVNAANLAQDAAIGAQMIHVADATSFKPNQAIVLGTANATSYALADRNIVQYVNYLDKIIYLSAPLEKAFSSATTVVKGGRIFFKNDKLGYGRVNAYNAVQLAALYKHDYRDLHIRDTLTDDGVTVPTGTVQINSPDIWVRNLGTEKFKDVDAVSTVSGNDPGYISDYNIAGDASVQDGGKHQNPIIQEEKLVYIRVHNRGTNLDSLNGSQAVVSITFTKSATPYPSFNFPEGWTGGRIKDENNNDEITHFLIKNTSQENLSETFNGTFDVGERGYDFSILTPYSQSYIKPLAPDGHTIMKFKWPKEIKPPNDTYRTFIKVHITPFDGVMAGPEVHLNNNLTYKQVTMPGIILH